jgi:hypothetical protein
MLCVIAVTNAILVIHTDETLDQLISQCGLMDGGNEWGHCFILVHHTVIPRLTKVIVPELHSLAET